MKSLGKGCHNAFATMKIFDKPKRHLTKRALDAGEPQRSWLGVGDTCTRFAWQIVRSLAPPVICQANQAGVVQCRCVRLKLTRPICRHPRQFPTPQPFPLGRRSVRPPQRHATRTQTVGLLKSINALSCSKSGTEYDGKPIPS